MTSNQNMSQPKLFSFIKTPCGRAKYLQLSNTKGVFAKIRFWWFIVFAVMKDLLLKNPDQS